MKKIMATLMLMLMVLSIVPLAFAQDTSVDVDANVDVNVGDDAEPRDSSDETDSDEGTDATETDNAEESDEASGRQVRGELATRATTAARAERAAGPGASVNVLARVREAHKARLEAALARCDQAENPERCKANVEQRLARLAQLTEQDLARIEKFNARAKDAARDLRALRANPGFAKFTEDGDNPRARRVNAEKAKNARERAKNAESKFVEHRKAFREHKEALDAQKQEAKAACEADAASESCAESKAEVKATAKTSMLRAADAALSQLEKVKARIEESEILSEAEATELLAKIDAKIAEVESIKAKIEALGEDATREEYEAVAKELRAIMKDLGKAVKAHVAKLVHGRMGGVIVRAKHLEAKLEHLLERMAEAGKDTSGVEPLVANFHAAIEEARGNYKRAQDAFRLNNAEAGHEALKAMHESLKEAHQILREIVNEVKDQGAEAELDAAVETDVEAEA